MTGFTWDRHASQAGPRAARDWRPLFLHDWTDTVMIHFAVDPDALRHRLPYEPDTFAGDAYVTLVAFTLRRMRLAALPRLGRVLLRPISDHRFLNLRAYVKHEDQRGIYFMREWLDNPLSVALGGAAYGLPYRYGRLDYRHTEEAGIGVAQAGLFRLVYRRRGPIDGDDYRPSRPGTADHFLLERYHAFLARRDWRGVFHVRHEPWPQQRIDIELEDDSLLATTGAWYRRATLAGAHQSPGVFDVEISRAYTLPQV